MEEHPLFITQDEIDSFLARGGSYSDGRLSTYAFYLQNKTEKEMADFLKERYGTGGCSHALDGADDSHADYNGKGLKLARGSFGNPDTQVLLKWPQVAKRVTYLIENDKFLKAADYSRMPGYEREQNGQTVSLVFMPVCQKKQNVRLQMIFSMMTQELNWLQHWKIRKQQQN